MTLDKDIAEEIEKIAELINKGKLIVRDLTKEQIAEVFGSEGNARRILSNRIYETYLINLLNHKST